MRNPSVAGNQQLLDNALFNISLDWVHRASVDVHSTPLPMRTPLSHHGVLAFDPITPRDVNFVLDHARALQLAARAGDLRASLRGRKFGLMCETDDDGDAALFRRAAVELGACVTQLRPSLTVLSTPQEVQHTARMLGRLYDAVECQGMAPDLVHRLGIDAGVPVYDGIATQHHPTAKLGALLEGDSPPLDKRRFVLQAVLLSTVA